MWKNEKKKRKIQISTKNYNFIVTDFYDLVESNQFSHYSAWQLIDFYCTFNRLRGHGSHISLSITGTCSRRKVRFDLQTCTTGPHCTGEAERRRNQKAIHLNPLRDKMA